MALDKNSIGKAKGAPAEAVSSADVDRAAAKATQQEGVEYGKKSGEIALVAPLGDPSDPDTTTKKDGQKTVTSTIVGYRFKYLGEGTLEIPECGTNDRFRTNKMNFVNAEGTRTVKSGEEFDLTPFETAYLISRPEYSGQFTGGENTAVAVYNKKASKTRKGEVTVTEGASIPRVSLRLASGSIKDMRIIDVLEYEEVKNEQGRTRKNRKAVPEFEGKWGVLCKKSIRRSSGRRTGAPKSAFNENAAAFLKAVSRETSKRKPKN